MQESRQRSEWFINTWAVVAAFGTYFCMYMFRKPFTVGSFERAVGEGWDEKGTLIAAQVIGYMVSKFIGIRVVSEVSRLRRAWVILGLILFSHAALLLFAVVPAPYHVFCMFLNGLPLGIVFGLVLGFLEGRQSTEALAAGLCASFILAGGVAKTVGQRVIDIACGQWGWELSIAERWMPFFSGAFFLVPICICVWMLHRIPPPSSKDIDARSLREPMGSEDRWRVLRSYSMGLGAIAGTYLLMSILRSFRDDFAPEILRGLGASVKAQAYANIDFFVMCLVTAANGSAVFIRDNRTALQFSFGVSMLGFATTMLSVLWHWYVQPISPALLMVAIGAGLYLPYVAVHTTVFERIIACTRDRANVGFLMYIADSVGYLGYVAVVLLKNQWIGGVGEATFASGFLVFSVLGAALSIVLIAVASYRFRALAVYQESSQDSGSSQDIDNSQVTSAR
jgi:Family of unknown function (DUF5690)